MTEQKINAHREGARSATDTLTGSGAAGLVLIGLKVFLETKGIKLDPDDLLLIAGSLTGIFTGLSSYIHGYNRGIDNTDKVDR